MKIYELTDVLPSNEPKKILVHTGENNLITLARTNETAYKMYKELLRRDYVLYFFDQGISKFQKRKYVNDLWVKQDLEQHNGVYYTVSHPSKNQCNKLKSNRLLVIFSAMPNLSKNDHYKIRERMFPQSLADIDKNIVKNVHIMRIMDLNVSHGSHYVKTTNYPEMENDIQLAIQKVAKELNVSDEDIVLYGVSKGGTGAMLHGSALDYKTISVDPIINLSYFNEGDHHFLKDFREVDLSERLNDNLQVNKRKKYIICSPTIAFNYENIKKISQHDAVKTIELLDDNIKTESEISTNSIPLQLMVINNLFANIF